MPRKKGNSSKQAGTRATNPEACHVVTPQTTKHYPQEMIDHILGYIDPGDRETLLSCCLTAQAFSPAATKSLFARLQITRAGFPSMMNQLRVSRLKGAAVRSLLLRGLGLHKRHSLSGGELEGLLSYLKNVEDVSIHDFYLGTPCDGLLSLPNATFLTTLTLKNVVLESMFGTLALICACKNLKTLNLFAVYWNNVRLDALEQYTDSLQVPALRALNTRGMKEDLAQYLFPGGDASHLEALGLQCRASGNRAWWRLFQPGTKWANLHTFTVHDLTDSVIPFIVIDGVVLPAFPKLRHLIFDANCAFASRTIFNHELLVTYLRLVNRSPLEEIVFSFVSVERDHVLALAVPLLIQCFYEMSFGPSLTRVTYRFQGHNLDATEIKEYIWQAYEAWERRDIVHVEVESIDTAVLQASQ